MAVFVSAKRTPGLGVKHRCVGCGTRFYDLGKPDPSCPKCARAPVTDHDERASEAVSSSSERDSGLHSLKLAGLSKEERRQARQDDYDRLQEVLDTDGEEEE